MWYSRQSLLCLSSALCQAYSWQLGPVPSPARSKSAAKAASSQLVLEVVQVVICSRKQQNVDDSLKALRGQGIDCQGCACHVGSRDHLKKLVKLAIDSYGRIDVLVSNAAVNPMSGAGPALPLRGSAPLRTFASSMQGHLSCPA